LVASEIEKMEVSSRSADGDGVARVRTPITNSGWLRTEEKAKILKWKWFEKRKAETLRVERESRKWGLWPMADGGRKSVEFFWR
jgi:hypothetical protein